MRVLIVGLNGSPYRYAIMLRLSLVFCQDYGRGGGALYKTILCRNFHFNNVMGLGIAILDTI